MWDDQAVPAELQNRLRREHERWQLVDRQIKDQENERARRIRTSKDKTTGKVRQLLRLRGIGANSAWLYVMEFFGWRRINNRKQVAALAGLTPTPYQSGNSDHEQGISKAGNRRFSAALDSSGNEHRGRYHGRPAFRERGAIQDDPLGSWPSCFCYARCMSETVGNSSLRP
jgi:transposase